MKSDSKWIRKILSLQQADGSWGYFHSLSKPSKERPMTTEQALRRLWYLGLTSEDEPIKKALQYMKAVISHDICPPDRREAVLNWDFFEQMMMAAWIRRFDPYDQQAVDIAEFWADIIGSACASGTFNPSSYEALYRSKIPKLHSRERLISVPQFYMVKLLSGIIKTDAERVFMNHIIENPQGIYYIYSNCISDTPEKFASLQTSHYIAALECLSDYCCAREKLSFASEWLLENKDVNGWDLGASAKDGVYFPLSNSWRKEEDRRHDCTMRIQQLLSVIT